ncbi:MAG: PKD domain-containing protein, partial [Bacteroidota bacterium]
GFCESTTIGSRDLNPSVNGTIDSYTWIIDNGSTTRINTETFDPIPFDQSGQIILQVDGPCGQVADTVDIVIINTAEISFSNNPNTLCSSNDPVQLNANPSGGRWQGEGQANTVVSEDGLLDPSDLRPGVYTFTYSNGSTGCEKEGSIDIEILEGVGVDLLEIDPSCESLSYVPDVRYNGQIDQYAWQFIGGTPNTAAVANPGPVDFNRPDSALVIIEVEGQCGVALDSIPILIQAALPVSISPIDQPICEGGGAVTLAVNQSGGRWIGTGVNEQSGEFRAQSVGPGTYTIQYQLDNGACSSSDEISIQVVASETVNTQDATICIDSEPTQLLANPLGGFWSGNEALDSSGLFDPINTNIGAGNFTVDYNYVDANNCKVIVETNVLVEDLPIIQMNRMIELCRSDFDANLIDLLSFQVSPAGGSTVWSGPGIIDQSNGIFNAIQSGLDTGEYQITLQYDRNDCTIFDSLTLRLIEARPLLLDADQQVCISENVLQLNTNLSGGAWEGPGIDENSGIIDLVAAGTGGGTFSYTYTFSPGTSCAQSGQVEVQIIDLASQIETGGQQEVCEGLVNATLSGASPANGFWRGPTVVDPARGIIELSGMTLDSVYNFEYCLESAAIAGCEACKAKPFIIRSNPIANFEIEGLPCIGETFQLSNQTQNGDQYNWNFGDGTQASEESPSISYDQQGTYNINLEAISAFGCSNEVSQDLYVTQAPTVAFDLAERQGCAPFEVIATNNSFGDSISQRWLIGRDTILGETLPNYFIDGLTDDSTLAIILEVENFCGLVNQIDSVEVRPYPLVNFGLSEDEGCSPLTVDLINTTQGNPDEFFWTYSNGQTSNQFEPAAGPFTTTDILVSVYDLELVATNECGADTLTKQVTVFPPDVEAFIELDTLEACQPLVFEAVSNSTPGARISWQFISPSGVEEGSQLNNPTVTMDEPGLHTIVLFASGCGTDMDTAQLEILPAPEVRFEHRPFVCQGASISFNNLSQGISGSNWDFGDGNQSSERSPVHIFDTVGTYTVTLTAFSAINNCPSTYTSTVEVVGLPSASFAASTTQGCGPLRIDFQNSTPNQEVLNFVWDFGDGTGKSFEVAPSHTFTNPGNYQVTLTAFNQDSCFSDTSILNVFVFPDPV